MVDKETVQYTVAEDVNPVAVEYCSMVRAIQGMRVARSHGWTAVGDAGTDQVEEHGREPAVVLHMQDRGENIQAWVALREGDGTVAGDEVLNFVVRIVERHSAAGWIAG